ncbi:MAG: hypothetical protein U9R44_04185 [Candidatus Omnitrophota bacterium]|nr:hypothetical protein [Candidatus Omnitrophota bacterium]
MRGIIKGVLAEELENSLRMKKEYEKALQKLPKGCIAVKNIRGREYCYLVRRVGKKVKYIYKGKMSKVEREKYDEAKKLRAKYRKLLSQVKKQIRFLRSSLRGKEAV